MPSALFFVKFLIYLAAAAGDLACSDGLLAHAAPHSAALSMASIYFILQTYKEAVFILLLSLSSTCRIGSAGNVMYKEFRYSV